MFRLLYYYIFLMEFAIMPDRSHNSKVIVITVCVLLVPNTSKVHGFFGIVDIINMRLVFDIHITVIVYSFFY